MKLADNPIRKRAQISKTNRLMFIWIAGASVLVGASSVVAIFLVQMLFFNERVLSEKDKTIKVLKINNDNVDPLKKNVLTLSTNKALISSKAIPDDQPIQVILDALPSQANSLALGASIKDRLLSNIDGLTLDSIRIDNVSGVDGLVGGDGAVIEASPYSSEQNVITFTFTVTGNEAMLQQVLRNLEISIRTIDVISLKIEGQANNTATMTVVGQAFYEPARDIKLTTKTVK